MTINMLTALSFNSRVGKKTYWNFKCECGAEKSTEVSNVLGGFTKSCGCSRAHQKINPKNNLRLRFSLYASYKFSAKKRGYVFEITNDVFQKIISSPCHYCGVEKSNKISQESRSKYTNHVYVVEYNGVDRKHNDMGYTIENCVPCCSLCNMAKKAMPYLSFIEWINRLKKFDFKPQTI